jgi:hypothetical protein
LVIDVLVILVWDIFISDNWVSDILPERPKALTPQFFSDRDSVLGHNFKIILLIRDPRAVINSLLKEPQIWKKLAPNPRMACTNAYSDLTAYQRSEGSCKRRLGANSRPGANFAPRR